MPLKVRLRPTTAAPWHPGHPFRPKGGRARNVLSALTLAVLTAVIGGYAYVTDGERVRRLAEQALSDAVGGKVHVGRARLSIFEGLRLQDVTISVDDGPGAPPAADAGIFHAESVYASFPWLKLAGGDLSGTRIIVVEPRVLIVSDREGKAWNLERLKRKPHVEEGPSFFKLSLPEVMLRDAHFVLAQREPDGSIKPRLNYVVEGVVGLDPRAAGDERRYTFALKGRGPTTGAGPTVTGSVRLDAMQFSAQMRDLQLDSDIASMFPDAIRLWWSRHGIAGQLELPVVDIDGASKTPRFTVVARLTGGTMQFPPEELAGEAVPAPGAGLPPIAFSDATGEMVFTEGGIELKDFALTHEGNVLRASGGFGGYEAKSPFHVRLGIDALHVPEHPTLVPSLPPEAREIYDRFLPSGDGKLTCAFSRDAAGQIAVDARVDITRGEMAFELFPYRARKLTGAIIVRTTEPGHTRLELHDLRGTGRPDSENRNADVRVDGWMGPLEGGMQVDVNISGDHLVADAELVAAMPDGVREAIHAFAPAGKTAPEFAGGFKAHVVRQPGNPSRWSWPIDIRVDAGRGAFEGFPYPLENVHGGILIDAGHVDINHMAAIRGTAALDVNGRVTYRDQPHGKLLYAVDVNARQVPIDDTLINAIPPDKRDEVNRLGLGGNLDLAGRITGQDAHYDLGMTIAHGTLRPQQLDFSPTPASRPAHAPPPNWLATDVDAAVHLTPDHLTIDRATAHRGGGTISASGTVTWGGEAKQLNFAVLANAHALPLDPELRALLPTDSQAGWDAVHPAGLADLAIDLAHGPARIEVQPLGISAMPSVFPVQLKDVRGTVVIQGDAVTLTNLTARRGEGSVTVGGTGSTRATGSWDLTLGAKGVDIDEELRRALPSVLRSTAEGVSLAGKGDVEIRKLRFTPGDSTGNTGSNADFDVSLLPTDMMLSVGVPMRVTAGKIDVAGTIRDDHLRQMTGTIRFRSGEMADRPVTNLSADVAKNPTEAFLRIDNFGGTLAEGQLAGAARISLPDKGSAAYDLHLVLRNADVRSLVGKKADDVSGRMQASLSLQGLVDDPGTRRGTGDISVVGDRLAKIPVMLGLVQIANLSLPQGTTFNNATAKYSLDGAHVIFDPIAIRAPGLEMLGSGYLDLDARYVVLTFTISPPDIGKVPVLSDLVDPLRRELFKFEVHGTIDDPKISAKSFASFTTTVDQVLRAGGKDAGGR